MRGGRAQSLASSPTMVGAITTLIVIVAVFLAYNAASGLPFVPVYRVSVELPNAQRLARNNEVRIGGFRVGVVEAITPIEDSERPGQAAAKLDLKLDKTVEPLPEDTEVRVRYKSSFGLKYLELTRGDGEGVPEGGTIPITQSSVQTEFDDIANTFDTKTRAAGREVLEGFGNALAARGASLNETIQNLDPLFRTLKPVAEMLVEPSTRLDRFFPALGRTAAIVAPVADQNAELFANMATTFAALSADTEALKETITTGVPTLEEGTVALRAQRPFLVDFADLSTRLRPAVAALRGALPTFNDALEAGTPVVLRLPSMNAELGRVFVSLQRLVDQPQTKTTILRLRDTFEEADPALRWIVPFQSVCNYWNYWFTYLPEHLTEMDVIGTTQRVSIIGAPAGQSGGIPREAGGGLAGYTGVSANGLAGVEPNPADFGVFKPRELPILHGAAYSPAVDNEGRADCQGGQTGYPLGRLAGTGQPRNIPAVSASNYPGNRGPTFHGRARIPQGLQPRVLP